jgi:exosome complex component RRP40
VDIGGPFKATLPALAFENASRRNRANCDVGSLVYARVQSAPRDAEPELSCCDAAGKAGPLGPLLGGLPFAVSTAAARRLLRRPPPPELAALGKALPYELVVGANGRCWAKAGSCADTVLVASTLAEAATLQPPAALELVQKALNQRAEAVE